MNIFILNNSKKKNNMLSFFNGPFDKGSLKKLISWCLKNYGEKPTLDFLENLKILGFAQATQAGISLGLDDLKIPDKKRKLLLETNIATQSIESTHLSGKITSIEKSQRMIDLWNTTSELIRENVIDNFKYKNPLNPLSMMAFSGARGNISQVRQLVGMRGLMADPQGAIVEFPIQSNFREGITLTEYLISCYGARKGLVDTALRTATSGYLTRRLVDAVQHLIISDMDCQADTGILIKNTKNESRLIGRVLLTKLNKNFLEKEKVNNYFPYFLSKNKISFSERKLALLKKNQIISLTVARQISKTKNEIYIRSPLTCQAYKSICQFCYGWDLAKGELVNIGEAIGIIAAQSIGEPGTQLTMRTFHTGGVGVFSDESLKTYKAPSSGIINFPEKLPGHFIRTPHGKIVYMLKYSHIEANVSLLEIKTNRTTKAFFALQKDQLLPGSILFVRQGERVNKNDIIAQTPQIQTNNQNIPESLHPIQSKIDGEIQFENINIFGAQNIYKNTSMLLKSITQSKFSKITENYIKDSTKKLLPAKEVIPMTNILHQIGNFWVFSANHQKELYSRNNFLQVGDLISLNSIFFQINFYVSFYAKIKQLNSEIIFERPALNLPINLMRFHKKVYSSIWYGKNKTTIFWKLKASTKRQKFHILCYSEKWAIQKLSFIFVSKKYFQFNASKINGKDESKKIKVNKKPIQLFRKRNQPILSFSINYRNHLKFYTPYFGNIFYIPYSFFLLKNFFIINIIYLTNTKLKLFPSGKFYKGSTLFIINTIRSFALELGIYRVSPNSIKISSSFLKSALKKPSVFFKDTKIKLKINNFNKFFYNYSSNYSSRPGKFVSIFFKKLIDNFVNNKEVPKNISCYRNNWIFLSTSKKKKLFFYNFNKSLKKFILLKNNILPNLAFENQAITLEYFPAIKLNVLKQKNLTKYRAIKLFNQYWYKKKFFLDYNNAWDMNFCISTKTKISNNLFKQIDKALIFYKLKKSYTQKRNPKLSPILKQASIEKKKNYYVLCVCVEKIYQKTLPCYINFQKQGASLLLNNYKFHHVKKNISPFFIKQASSKNFSKENVQKLFVMQPNFKIGWRPPINLLTFKLIINSQKDFKTFYSAFIPEHFQKIKNENLQKNMTIERKMSFKRETFQLLSYTLPPKTNFTLDFKNLKLQTFNNGWVFPMIKIATGFKLSRITGDLIRYTQILNQSYWSSLNQNNIITLKLPIKSTLLPIKLGQFYRWGQSISSNFGSPVNGKVIRINEDQISIRYGLPIIASKYGIIHVLDNEIILKNKLLVTLKSRKLQTQDIVQGIPKIEQLFEARAAQGGDNSISVHEKLQYLFLDFLEFFYEKQKSRLSILALQKEQFNYFRVANKAATVKMQNFIVYSIIEAYLNQGVSVSEKHIEVVVREMTARVRVLSSGSSGFLPGEFVQLKAIQRVNNKLLRNSQNPAIFDPILLGITKSVLYSESFLLAASFQEVSRVLVRSVFYKKTDFLSGLHENVIVGQIIPAGASIFLKINNGDKFKQFKKSSKRPKKFPN